MERGVEWMDGFGRVVDGWMVVSGGVVVVSVVGVVVVTRTKGGMMVRCVRADAGVR